MIQKFARQRPYHQMSVPATLAVLVLLAGGCTPPSASEATPGAAPPASIAPTEGTPSSTAPAIPILTLSWIPYQDDRIVFERPADGAVERSGDGSLRVLGPLVPPADVGYASSEPDQPAFELTISRHPNPAGLTAEAWGRLQVLNAYATTTAEGGPQGGLPVDERGVIDEGKVRSTTLGGRPAFLVTFFQFDSERNETYVSDGDTIVALSHDVNIVGNVPIAEQQLAACAHILDSVHWMAEK